MGKEMKKGRIWKLLLLIFVFSMLLSSQAGAKNQFNYTLLYPHKEGRDQIYVKKLSGVPGSKIKISYSKKGIVQVVPIKETYDGRKWPGTYNIFAKKPGTTTVSITGTKKGKKITYKGKITVEKYSNPFSKLKIDGKSYLSKTTKIKVSKDNELYNSFNIRSSKATMKIDWKLKPGWKMESVSDNENTSGMLDYVGEVKNGKKFSIKGKREIEMLLQHKKSHEYVTITIKVN